KVEADRRGGAGARDAVSDPRPPGPVVPGRGGAQEHRGQSRGAGHRVLERGEEGPLTSRPCCTATSREGSSPPSPSSPSGPPRRPGGGGGAAARCPPPGRRGAPPAAIIAGDNATAPQVEAIRAKLGLDRPIAQQFVIWIGDIARGDLGESFFFKKPVTALIADRIEPTAALAVCTIVLAVLLAVPLGVTAAYRRGRWIDRLVIGISVLGFSVPAFVVGYVLIYVFAIQFGWLPVQGYQRLAEGFGGFIERLILPSITLATVYVALIARITRGSVLEVLAADYVRTAQ